MGILSTSEVNIMATVKSGTGSKGGKSMMNKGMFSSKTDLWATPQGFFDEWNDKFDFDLDVCADHENHKCKRYFTKENDGLSLDWNGEAVRMNPPYGREIGKWVKKASESNTTVVGLLPARTDTRWFHDYIKDNAEIHFVKGRLKFGEATTSAPFPSMVVIWQKKA
jgi:site-specific DNA-methyltransferase (adenine-specific)